MNVQPKVLTCLVGVLFLSLVALTVRGPAQAQSIFKPSSFFPRQSELYSLRLSSTSNANVATPNGNLSARTFTVAADAQGRLPVIQSTNGDFVLYRLEQDGYRICFQYEPSASAPRIGQMNPGFVLMPGSYALRDHAFIDDGDRVVATGYLSYP